MLARLKSASQLQLPVVMVLVAVAMLAGQKPDGSES